jgi:hypothetical protein
MKRIDTIFALTFFAMAQSGHCKGFRRGISTLIKEKRT